MPPNSPYMSGYLGQPGTMYGGMPMMNQMDLNGLPGMNGPQGMMMQMLLQPFLSNFMGQYGFMPGQFMPTQNIYDHMMSRSVFMNNQQAMATAATTDTATYYRAMRGVSNLTGTRFGLEQDAAARSMANDISGMGPTFAMFAPEFFDRLHGVRGSATVMSHYLHMGGRYMRDPATGLTGISGQGAGVISQRLFESMYGEGADLGAMRGLGAGEMGRMYDELGRRGFVGSMGRSDRNSILRRFRPDADAMSEDDVGKFLSGADGASAKTELFKGEADRIRDRLKNLAGAVSAMRDIFGDMGKPNAPIPEIINGLQMLTQGGLANIPRGDLEGIVRNTYNLAKNSGMGLENMSQLMARGAGLGDALGLPRTNAVFAAQNAAAFGAAFGDRSTAGLAYFGAPDKDRVTMLELNLQQSAGASRQAQLMNAALYIGDNFGGLAADSEAASLVGALKSGQTSYFYGGQMKSAAMSSEGFLDIFGRGGVNRQLALNVLASPAGLQETGLKYRTADMTRQMQRQLDVEPAFMSITSLMTATALPGANPATVNALSEAGMRAAFDMPEGKYADEGERTKYIAERMAEASGGQFTAAQLQPLAASIIPRYRHFAATNPRFQGYGSFEAMRLMMSPEIAARAAEIRSESNITSDLQSSFSRLGRIDPLRRLVTLLTDRTTAGMGGDEFAPLLAEALGGIDIAAVTGITDKDKAKVKFGEEMDGLRDMSKMYYNTKDPVQRAAILKKINTEVEKIQTRAGKSFAMDTAVTGPMMEDLRRLSDEKDNRTLEFAGDLSSRMLTNKGNLDQLGKGGTTVLKDIMADNNALKKLMGESGAGSLKELLDRKDAIGIQANAIYDRMNNNLKYVEGRVRTGKIAEDDQAMTEEEKADLKRAQAMSTREPGEILQDLEKAVGGTVGGDKRAGAISSIKDRRDQVNAALSDLSKLRDVARRIGVDPSLPAKELISKLKDQKDKLTPAEQRMLDRVQPLTELSTLTLDGKSIDKAFPGSPAGMGSEPAKTPTPTSMKISGEVKLKMPNTLVFEDTNGAIGGAGAGTGAARHEGTPK